MAFDLPYFPPPGQWTEDQLQVWWQQVRDAIVQAVTTQEAVVEQLVRAVSEMPDLAPVTITADYTGTVNPAAQLPKYIQATRLYNGVDVTTDSAWTLVSESGAVTASVGAVTGLVEITAIVGSDNLTVTSDYLGVELSRIIPVALSVAPPIPGSASDSAFASFNSTSHAAVSDELTVTVGASGVVNLSAPLSVTTASSFASLVLEVFGKWQWWNGASWADVGTEVASNPDVRVHAGGAVTDGALSVPQSKTGLTPAATEKFRLTARNSSGTRTMYLVGTATAAAA